MTKKNLYQNSARISILLKKLEDSKGQNYRTLMDTCFQNNKVTTLK